ncbi:MAG TPA: dihydrofolate reductase family protein, partial [Roseiarcus sp.]|nr:dihydrofolate reductase family protein [Roseiarcus sp.]
TSEEAPSESAKALEDIGFEIARIEGAGADRLDLRAALRLLAERGVTRVFSEGGPRIASALIGQNLADEVILFTAQKPLGRPGLPALDASALVALEDRSRYAAPRLAHFGADEMRLYQRRL